MIGVVAIGNCHAYGEFCGADYFTRIYTKWRRPISFTSVQNHPFVDGNKRVGAVAAYVFLALNNVRLTADPADFEELVMSVARGETSKSSVASFFRNNSAPA